MSRKRLAFTHLCLIVGKEVQRKLAADYVCKVYATFVFSFNNEFEKEVRKEIRCENLRAVVFTEDLDIPSD